MRLEDAVHSMPYREFVMLVGGLSPHSAFANRIGRKGQGDTRYISDPEEGMRAVSMIMGV